MYKCIVFDFDGTIGDTEDLAIQVACTLADKHNFRKVTKAEIPMIRTMSAREAIAYMGVSRFRLPFILREAQKILRKQVSSAPLCREDLHDFLRQLQKSSILSGVITSNAQENVRAFLQSHDIDGFDFVWESSIFGKSKHFKRLMAKYNVKAQEILYVGDEARDVHAAQKAKIDVAVVTWGFNTKERLQKEKPDYIVEDVNDLFSVVASSMEASDGL